MRGKEIEQQQLFSYVSTEKKVPANHPLRKIKEFAEVALDQLAPKFEGMYCEVYHSKDGRLYCNGVEIDGETFNNKIFCHPKNLYILGRKKEDVKTE